MRLSSLAFLLVALLAPAIAAADPGQPPLAGGTVEVGLGATGSQWTSGDGSIAESNLGGASANLAIGHFVGERAVFAMRAAVTWYDSGNVHTSVFGLVGPATQYWIDDRLFVGATAGIAFDHVVSLDRVSDLGPGLELRAGYTVFREGHHAVHLSVAGTYGYYAVGVGAYTAGLGGDSRSLALQIGWQYL